MEFETTSPLLKEELLTAPSAMAERTAVEGLPLLLLAVWIIPPVEPGAQLRVAEDFICLVDLGHFLLGLLLGHALRGCLVRVEFLGQGTVLPLDEAVVGVGVDVEDFVVVFGFGPFQHNLGFLLEAGDLVSVWVMFLGSFKGFQGGFVVGRVDLALGLREEGGKGGGDEGEGFVAVGERFLFVVHLGARLTEFRERVCERVADFGIKLASHLDQSAVEFIWRILMNVA